MKINLDSIATRAPDSADKSDTKDLNKELQEKIALYQRKMYAEGKQSMLIILQGMDASGKDGTIRRLFTGINPLGCHVAAFKKPTPLEADHDFLWRVHKHTPPKGIIQIFNRSHYEDILVPSVEGYIDQELIEKRYDHINDFERLLTDHGTMVLKFYLHVSREEQLESLTDRLHNPEKYWKHNDGDRANREKWDQYMKVYHEIFKKTDTKHAPRHIIAADQNRWKVHQVGNIIIDAFEKMNPHRPELDTEKFIVVDDD